MSVQDSESRRFEQKFGLSFSQADLGPRSAQELFVGVFESLKRFFRRFVSPVFYQVYSSTQMCLYQTPGRRPPPTTGRCMNTVTRGWVGAPNGRAPFRFHSAVVGFVDRCLSKTRNLAGSNKHWAKFSQADLGPRSAQESFFSGFLKSLIFFFEDLHS